MTSIQDLDVWNLVRLLFSHKVYMWWNPFVMYLSAWDIAKVLWSQGAVSIVISLLAILFGAAIILPLLLHFDAEVQHFDAKVQPVMDVVFLFIAIPLFGSTVLWIVLKVSTVGLEMLHGILATRSIIALSLLAPCVRAIYVERTEWLSRFFSGRITGHRT